ncbi:MAG: hypothetical protein IT343_08405 [Candidatus Melainabacteria bacterium]|nr:hypothetical protein [Candidatus Melainabacteria bacterium]
MTAGRRGLRLYSVAEKQPVFLCGTQLLGQPLVALAVAAENDDLMLSRQNIDNKFHNAQETLIIRFAERFVQHNGKRVIF